jgi:hypothetical protein
MKLPSADMGADIVASYLTQEQTPQGNPKLGH